MKMKLGAFRRLVREELVKLPALVTLDQLSVMQDELDDALTTGRLSQSDYEREWMETLRSFGWTPEMYEREVDRRWDYVGTDSDVIVAPRSYGAN